MKFIQKAFLFFIAISLTACHTFYGNEKINSNSNLKKISLDGSKTDLQKILGKPNRIHKSSDSANEIYEYEYHESLRSNIYYIPLVSVFYYGFGQNPFSFTRTVKASVDHRYLMVEVDPQGKIVGKDFYEENDPARFYEISCSNQGNSMVCNDNRVTAKTFLYEK